MKKTGSQGVGTSAPLFNDYGTWLRAQFGGEKVQKIAVNAGFSCPNRDGTVGLGGCTYCNNQTFNPEYCTTEKTVAQQLEEGKDFFARKYPEMKYLAYFQAYTNTYGKTDRLKAMYEEALGVDGVVGLVIGTRPDCMPDELLDYLGELNERTFLVVEYGVESVDNGILRRINRGHDFECAVNTIRRTADRGIKVGIHMILGLPGETDEMILSQPQVLSELPVSIVKLHQLQIIRDTGMAREYSQHPDDFVLMTPERYSDLVVRYIERLRPDMVIERFVSQSPAHLVVAPRWGLKNYQFTEMVKKLMRERKTSQGCFYCPK